MPEERGAELRDGWWEQPAREGRGGYEDRGSRFLGWAFPCASEPQFAERLRQLRAEHPKARHHCWAWRLRAAQRFSDDGEPGGSAGRPIYRVLEGSDLVQAGIIVVRYFGGVKLGTGGLARAYSAAASQALAAAGRERGEESREVELFLPFAQSGLRGEIAALFPGLVWRAESYDEAGWHGRGQVGAGAAAALGDFLRCRGAAGLRWKIGGTEAGPARRKA